MFGVASPREVAVGPFLDPCNAAQPLVKIPRAGAAGHSLSGIWDWGS
jgi:hypothetical protein